jgi:site-specific DNA-methyltransferase (adenine-specific)
MIQTTQEWRIGDCVELMQEMPAGSTDLVIADPPYYRIDNSQWDRQWKTFDEYLNWIETIATEIKRVLKPNGSLFVFGDDHRIAYVQVRLDKHFSFLNHLIWYKRNNQSIKGAMNSRRYACVSERILFYEQKSATGLPATGLQEIHSTVMRGEYQKVMDANGFKTKAECDEYLNEITDTKSVVTRHYFSDSQYCFPTLELYTKLQTTGFFQRDYEDLRRDYEDLRRDYEDLRRVFNPTKGMYELFDIPIIGGAANTPHPTQKPVELIERLIQNTTNEGDTVLDPFLGSGTTLEAGRRTNRNVIGFEIDLQWQHLYSKRSMAHTPPLTSYFETEP